MIPDGGITTVGKRAGAPVAYARRVVGIPAEYPCRNPAKHGCRRKNQVTETTVGWGEEDGWWQYLAMKLQWLWRMQCHITSSLILDPANSAGSSSACGLRRRRRVPGDLPASDC
jgi:hypothetical protein